MVKFSDDSWYAKMGREDTMEDPLDQFQEHVTNNLAGNRPASRKIDEVIERRYNLQAWL